jgi:uncharacterized protein involved in type VI secretion and phage assembly
VDIELLGGYSKLLGVPLAVPKVNATNGEEWTPDEGDIVIVQFINGRFVDPIVTGWTHLPSNLIQAEKADAPSGKRRYHLRCNKTDIVIDKDGNRQTYVSKDEILDVSDNMTVTILSGNYTISINEGNLTINVDSGNASLTVAGDTSITTAGNTTISTTGNTAINTNGDTEVTSAGATNITSQGKVTVQSDATIELNGGSSSATGVVTKDCLCALTGRPHSDYSADVTASKG